MISPTAVLRKIVLLMCLSATFAACGLEKEFIFLPDREITYNPSDVGLPFENLTLTTADGVDINGWFIPATGARTTLLWFHGNGGNLSNRVDSIRTFRQYLNLNILMIDYRQYGESGGRISEEGTYRDADAAFDYLTKNPEVDPARIVVFGQSLGSAVAVDLAVRRRFSGLILVAPFTSIRDMAREDLPWLPIWGLLKIRYDSLSKIKRIDMPLLVLHGDRDEVVPYAQGKRLFEAAREPKTFYTIPGAGHNNTFRVGGEAYFSEIRNFIDGLPAVSPDRGPGVL
jgi:fermentation-respiration switch protein FrsA (DUF1100 family)